MPHRRTRQSPRTRQVWKRGPVQRPRSTRKAARGYDRKRTEHFVEGSHPHEHVSKGEVQPAKVAVLLSGGGRTLQNIVDRIDRGKLDARVMVVVSSRPGVKGIERAEKQGIDVHVVPRKEYPDTESFSAAINEILARYDIELIVMAGFLCLYTAPDHLKDSMINIHPALIPSFCGDKMYGHYVHEAVLEYGAKVSGCTVHFADDQYDAGPVIIQRTVPVLDDDTPDTLAARVFEAECEAYPEAIQLFAEGRLRIEGRRVRILDESS